jgi:hypothetical protein
LEGRDHESCHPDLVRGSLFVVAAYITDYGAWEVSPEPADEALWPPVRIDSFLLADWADTSGGKLYVGGGGFDRVAVHTFDVPIRFFYAALLAVPWVRTNERTDLRVWLETADGQETGFEVRGQIVVGRSPAARSGQDMLVALTGPVMVQLQGPTDLVLRMTFGDHDRRLRFSVTQADEQPGVAPIGRA